MGRLPHFLSYVAPRRAWSSANNINNNNYNYYYYYYNFINIIIIIIIIVTCLLTESEVFTEKYLTQAMPSRVYVLFVI